MKTWILLLALGAALPARPALAGTCRVRNFTARDLADEVFRLPGVAPAGDVRVTLDGAEVPSVVDEVGGERAVWARASLPAGASAAFEVAPGAPAATRKTLLVRRERTDLVLDNGLCAVKVPAGATPGAAAPAPVSAVRLGGRWVGAGRWDTSLPLASFRATVVDEGRVFGRVRLRYEFAAPAGAATPAFAEVDVTVAPGQPFAQVEERHAMDAASAWEFEATAGWKATGSVVRPHSGGMGDTKRDAAKAGTLQPGQIAHQDPALLLNLFPRWNQHCKDGWVAAATGADGAVGAVTVLAGRWLWPHDNSIRALVAPSADRLALRCPTRHGRRYWWLAAGDAALFADAQALATRHAYESLDTLLRDVPLAEWDGAGGAFRGYWPLSGDINPTGPIRGRGKALLRDVGRPVRDLGDLTQAQAMLSPNVYGSYWLFWSPENPNFFTDFNKVPLLMACRLREHPRHAELARMAVARFREDVHHAVALPSGAGNECPGYQQYAMKHYLELAKLCGQHLGEDATEWPHFRAAARFAVRVSQPLGGGKRGSHPGGDTHPGYVFADPREFAAEFGVREDVAALRTEELANFGVVFRNRAGTDRETYLAFKSGPARGHYHGDQLSFHYCAGGRPVAVDHRCSYHPRAGQEHMHNRVAFHTAALPYANLDGYERVIAFETGEAADAAIGQVENTRLRAVEMRPPEQWHQEWPVADFGGRALVYRRTLVQLKGGERDAFVVRDQYASPEPVSATYSLHVLGGRCERRDRAFEFDGMTLHVASPSDFAVDSFDWSHENGGPESTKGLRLTTRGAAGEFVTVLVPRAGGGAAPAVAAIPGGVRVGEFEVAFGGTAIDDDDATAYVVVKRAGRPVLELTGRDVDLDRDQGRVGLFVPDAGYPFGEIPDWLIRQRAPRPDWAPDWARRLAP